MCCDRTQKLNGMEMAAVVGGSGCHCSALSRPWTRKVPHAFLLKPRNSRLEDFGLSSTQLRNKFQRRPCLICRNNSSFLSNFNSVNPDVALQEAPDRRPPSVWIDFSRCVSGEWEGHGADFSHDGKPVELPESVVPEAFREWDVKVYDWQTQCPTFAEETTVALVYKLIRLLPTVGCEADAATQHSIHRRQIGGVDNEVLSFAFHPSGCYIAVWPSMGIKTKRHFLPEQNYVKQEEKCDAVEIEHCLVEGQNSESRVRIIQHVNFEQINNVQKTRPTLQSIAVYVEQWHGPFKNGEQLGGCTTSGPGFASTSPLCASQISGLWQAQNFAAELEAKSEYFMELVAYGYEDITRDFKDLVLLPKNLWCTLRDIGNDHFISEVGWLLDPSSTIMSSIKFSIDGKLKKAIVRFEELCTRSSAG